MELPELDGDAGTSFTIPFTATGDPARSLVQSTIASSTSDQDAISSGWHEPTVRAFQLIVTGVLGE
jgi:hypothetical protein